MTAPLVSLAVAQERVRLRIERRRKNRDERARAAGDRGLRERVPGVAGEGRPVADSSRPSRDWRARLRHEFHWLAFGGSMLAGGGLWALALFGPSSPAVYALKVLLVLILAGAGAAAIVRGLLVGEE